VFAVLPSTTSHKAEPLLPTLEMFARLGFRDIDLNLHHLREGSVTVKEVLQTLDAGGQTLGMVSGGWCDFYDSAPKVEETFASVDGQVRFALALGVRTLRLFYGRLPRTAYSPEARRTIAAHLTRLSDAYPEMTFAFENHDGASLDPAVCAEVLAATARPNIRMNFDPSNFERHGVDSLAALDVLRPYIEHVHLKGKIGEENCEFGAGDVDLTPVLRSLIASGYRGAFTVEYEGRFDRTLRLFLAARRAAATLHALADVQG
jgi:sugar phosphate isomerase/epimerase